MKRVLHISSAKTWRGGEQQIAYILENQSKGFEHMVFAPKGSELLKWASTQGLNSIGYVKHSGFSLRASKNLKKAVRQHNIDVLHVHDAHAHNTLFLAHHIFRLNTPAVLSRRVDFTPSRTSSFKYNLKAIKRIVCVSDFVRSIMQKRVKETQKLITIHDGVRPQKQEHKSFFRKTYNISKDTLLIGNVAALADHKDYPTFVRTAKELLEKHQIKAKFLMIGIDAESSVEVKEMIAQLGLSEKILHTGYVTDLKSKLSELDVFLFTSKEEGLGSSLIDAFNAKVPVVATKAGGIPEIVKHNQTGLLADISDYKQLAEHVMYLIKNSKERKKLIDQAQESALNFTDKVMAEKTHEVYLKVLL